MLGETGGDRGQGVLCWGWVGAGRARGGGAGLPGRARLGGGTCRCAGNVGNVSKKLQAFRNKERALIGFVDKERGSLGKQGGGLGKECILWAKKKSIILQVGCVQPNHHLNFSQSSLLIMDVSIMSQSVMYIMYIIVTN